MYNEHFYLRMSLKSIVLFILTISWQTVQSNTLQHVRIKQDNQARRIVNGPEMAPRNDSNGEQHSNELIAYTEYRHVTHNNNTVIATEEKQKTFFQYQPTHLSRQNVKSTGRKSLRILQNSDQVTLKITSSADILSNALTELMYQPVAVLVEDTIEMYKSAIIVMDKLADNLNIRNEFWLMKFNSSGTIINCNLLYCSKYTFIDKRNVKISKIYWLDNVIHESKYLLSIYVLLILIYIYVSVTDKTENEANSFYLNSAIVFI